MNMIWMMRQVLAHPVDFYEDIQQPGRLKWSYGVMLILLAFAARMISIMVTGFEFQTREPYEISYVKEFIWILLPWLTWSISNWGVSAIMDGEGKFKEVLVGSAFAMVPYIVLSVPLALLATVLTLSEKSIYSFLTITIFVWVGLLLLIKVKVVHDFEFGKLTWITVISLIGVAIVWFISILMFGLANQFVNFILDLIKELRFRM
jgi:hypothetical protein